MYEKIGLSRAHYPQSGGAVFSYPLSWKNEWEFSGYFISRLLELCVDKKYRICVTDDFGKLGENGEIAQWNALDPMMIIEPHANTGGENYSVILYLAGSVKGKRLAECIATSLGRHLPWRVIARAASKGGSFDRGIEFYEKTKGIAIIAEMFFCDNPNHKAWFSSEGNLRIAASSIIRGIEDFLKSGDWDG